MDESLRSRAELLAGEFADSATTRPQASSNAHSTVRYGISAGW